MFHVLFGSSELKVVHVDDEEKLELGMKEARWPRRPNWLKTDLADLLVAVVLPTCTTVGMTIQCLQQGADRLPELAP